MILRFGAGQKTQSSLDDDDAIITPGVGVFDERIADAFEYHLHQVLAAKRSKIGLCFSEVGGIDSKGLECLINARLLCERRSVDFQVVKAPEDLEKILQLANPQLVSREEEKSDNLYRQPLGRILVSRRILGPAMLNQALDSQKESPNERLGETLVRLRMCTEEDVYEALAIQANMPFVRISSRVVDPDVQELVASELIEAYQLMPLLRVQDRLLLACCDAPNPFVRQEIESQHDIRVVPIFTLPGDIVEVQKSLLDNTADVEIDSLIGDLQEMDVELITEDLVTDIGDASQTDMSPVIRLVNFLFFKAVRERASDIHIEPQESYLRVRNRIDGMLYESMRPPYSLYRAIVSRIKIMSNMDIAESRKPQDGRIRVRLEGRSIDFRVSTCPTNHGEKVVLRILDRATSIMGMENLGMESGAIEVVRSLIRAPNGIFLTTGPTGCGKTTTLYTMLNEINDHTRNICTAEDPIEFDINSVNQVQVNAAIGRGFAETLRTFLRQDPDVIMVGEVRDRETAEVAIQAALTGHLVFSTLHTNSAPGAISRLMHFKIEPFLIAASMIGCMAQRLVRRVCPECRELVPASKLDKTIAEREGVKLDTFFGSRGCSSCRGTGFSGRIGLYEIYKIDDGIRDIIMNAQSLVALKKAGRERGYQTLMGDGLRKVKQGLTTPTELFRVAGTGG